MFEFGDLWDHVKARKYPLEPIEVHPDVEVELGAPPDMVVDFGTTATVVALVNQQRVDGRSTISLNFLAGEQQHLSDMFIDTDGTVKAVGQAAVEMRLQAGTAGTYYTSLKRYLELSSRDPSIASGVSYDDIVSLYLRKSIEDRYRYFRRPVAPGSKVVISVPNSFNPEAVQLVSKGVIHALNYLNDALDATNIKHLNEANVRIVRESEAVAYLYLRQDQIDAGTALGARAFQWSGDDREKSAEKIIVLDVGGGTTDLSLIDATETNAGHCRLDVRMNAGVPLGGTDVDKVLLRAMLKDPLTIDDFDLNRHSGRFSAGQWYEVLDDFRQRKENGRDFSPEITQNDLGDLRSLLEKLTPAGTEQLTLESVELFDNDGEIKAQKYRGRATTRIDLLTTLSVDGLFNLIPQTERESIRTVLLTGRASQLPQIREAVRRQAEALGARVRTLSEPYQLKLVVAYGCALVCQNEFVGAFLPSNTVGRRISLFRGPEPIAELSSDLPVSSDVPVVWEVSCPRPGESAVDAYQLWEYKVSVGRDVLAQIPERSISPIGCSRQVAQWKVFPSGLDARPVRMLIAWHPAKDTYFAVKTGQWVGDERTGLDPLEFNPVTGLPLGFPTAQNP